MSAFVDDILSRCDVELGENDRCFLERVYTSPGERYLQRIRAIGFSGMNVVLDAGCGFGQWTRPLAELNGYVHAIDFDRRRVSVCQTMLQQQGITTVTYHAGKLESLPLDDQSVDGIFCYSVIFATDWLRSLQEFRRVVRPGGQLYLTANDIGWTLQRWLESPNAAPDHDPREAAARNFLNTVQYEKHGIAPETGQIIIARERMCERLEMSGFSVVASGAEGTISTGEESAEPLCQGSYRGLPAVYEVLAVRE